MYPAALVITFAEELQWLGACPNHLSPSQTGDYPSPALKITLGAFLISTFLANNLYSTSLTTLNHPQSGHRLRHLLPETGLRHRPLPASLSDDTDHHPNYRSDNHSHRNYPSF